MTPVSGTAHLLRAGCYEAAVAGVGASLRSLTYEGRDLVVPFAADEIRPVFRGATLAPWPNRVVDGIHAFGGAEHRLALSEPGRGHALHGLTAWTNWDLVDEGAAHVTLATTIEAQTGYPWRVRVETTYTLDDDGLVQTVRARTDAPTPAPWGTGPHPYLVGASGTVDEWTLALPAAEVLEVTPDRLSPVALAAVDATDAPRFDYRAPRVIGTAEIDHAYTALIADDEGLVTVTVTDAAGRGSAIAWAAAECPWVQVHTADQPDPAASALHRVGLAVEPMTCAPDAFNAHRYPYDAGLRTLVPGEWSAPAGWRIRAVG